MNGIEPNSRTEWQESYSILELSSEEARKFLLKHESYCNLDLPPYFVFGNLLERVAEQLNGKNLSDFQKGNPRKYEYVNYKILNNKDGTYAWRSFQLIHPALYISLVYKITTEDNWRLVKKKFEEFSENEEIECVSIPRVSSGKEKDKAN